MVPSSKRVFASMVSKLTPLPTTSEKSKFKRLVMVEKFSRLNMRWALLLGAISKKLPFVASNTTPPRNPLISTFNGDPGQLASTTRLAVSDSTLEA